MFRGTPCMLRIADQTAGLIGLTFFVVTNGWPRGVIGKKNIFFHGQRRTQFEVFFLEFSSVSMISVQNI